MQTEFQQENSYVIFTVYISRPNDKSFCKPSSIMLLYAGDADLSHSWVWYEDKPGECPWRWPDIMGLENKKCWELYLLFSMLIFENNTHTIHWPTSWCLRPLWSKEKNQTDNITCNGLDQQQKVNVITHVSYQGIAVATIEADEAIASSDFLKILGISPPKMSQPGQFWSVLITLPRLIFNVWLRLCKGVQLVAYCREYFV